MSVKKFIREGEMIPKYYGVAYRSYDMYGAVCYPIPINIIVGVVNKSVLWLKHGHKLYENGYSKGYQEGYNNGRDYAFNQFRDQVITQEAERLVKRGVEAFGDIFKLSRKDEGKATGYFWKVIEEEKDRIKKKFN